MCITAILTALLAAMSPSGKGTVHESQAIAYAKGINVARLDKSLPEQRLEDWVRVTLAPTRKVVWRTSDCGLKPDRTAPREGHPMCGDFVVSVGEVGVWGRIVIGTDRKGICGEPRVHDVSMLKDHGTASRSTDKLSEVPTLLTELR